VRLALALILAAGAALAHAPESSLHPQPRRLDPEVGMAAAAPLRPLGLLDAPGADQPLRPRPRPAPAIGPALPGKLLMVSSWTAPPAVARPPLRPRPRPASDAAAPGLPEQVVMVAAPGLPTSLRPTPRPENLRRRHVVAAMVPVQPDPGVIFGRKGSLCGVDAIKGTTLSPIGGKLKGCGIPDPVQVTSVQGVALSTPAVTDCTTAKALNAWVKGAVLPRVGKLGGGVARLEVAASYSCRPRNNQAGAKLSEHGRGHAIDISGITLKNGVTISVLKGWADRTHGAMMKALHKAACGPFGTVLGPASDGFHRDHFHLDTARYRSGSYCR
jgi:hypothetical protein